MTLIQAQQQYIQRVNCCHPGHQRRVERAARKQLGRWARKCGFNSKAIIVDANDMAVLERNSDD